VYIYIGLNGDEMVIDIGSPSFLLPSVNLDKVYDIKDFAKVTGTDPLFVIGAGAGPWPHVGVNCEVRHLYLQWYNCGKSSGYANL